MSLLTTLLASFGAKRKCSTHPHSFCRPIYLPYDARFGSSLALCVIISSIWCHPCDDEKVNSSDLRVCLSHLPSDARRVQVPAGHPQCAGSEEGRLQQLHQLDAHRHAHLRRRQGHHQEPRPPLLHLRRAGTLRRRPEAQRPRAQDAAAALL